MAFYTFASNYDKCEYIRAVFQVESSWRTGCLQKLIEMATTLHVGIVLHGQTLGTAGKSVTWPRLAVSKTSCACKPLMLKKWQRTHRFPGSRSFVSYYLLLRVCTLTSLEQQ